MEVESFLFKHKMNEDEFIKIFETKSPNSLSNRLGISIHQIVEVYYQIQSNRKISDLTRLQNKISSIEIRLDQSYAGLSKKDIETEILRAIKTDFLIFSYKVIVGVIIFLVGTGFFLLKELVNSQFWAVNQQYIRETKNTYKAMLDTAFQDAYSQDRHDFGMQTIYLMEMFCAKNNEQLSEDSLDYFERLFSRAKSQFEHASEKDIENPYNYFELGRIHSTIPMNCNISFEILKDKFKSSDAPKYFDKAISLYKNKQDIEKGYEAEAYINKANYAIYEFESRKDSQKVDLLNSAYNDMKKAEDSLKKNSVNFYKYFEKENKKVQRELDKLKNRIKKYSSFFNEVR